MPADVFAWISNTNAANLSATEAPPTALPSNNIAQLSGIVVVMPLTVIVLFVPFVV